MSYNTAHPHVASYVIFRKGEKVAFVLRSNTGWMNNYYGLPSGKVETKEPFLAAAVREAKEEVGVEVSEQNLEHILTVHRYEPSAQASDWVDVYFEAKQWKGELINAEPDVHSELAWLDPHNLPDNVIPSVVAAFSAIEQKKAYSEYGWDT